MAIERERLDLIKKTAQAQEAASLELARSAVSLWRSQLDMALEFGDEEVVRDALKNIGPVAWGDNNCQCARGNATV